MSDETFLWHDFETFGADPRRDRPAQFAARRTDTALNPIGEPEVLYCRPADDMLPQPMACLITGITPQTARERGLPENEFAARIFELMSARGTCSVGYNNFRFDDEVTRHLFWRNFIDPYEREWANGNSRFDLIDLMRLARAVRPEGIEWPDYEDGRPSFRLEDLAAANGMDTSQAHDALADVNATIAMARLLKENQPKLWDWALGLRNKNRVTDMLSRGDVMLHASSRFPALPGCGVAPILPLARHPQIASQWLIWNLNVDPEPFLELTAEELADRYWTPAADLPEGIERVPVKLVRNNRCPMLAPMNVLEAPRAAELGIDLETLDTHAGLLRDRPDFAERLGSLFAGRSGLSGAADPELDLYGGFPPRSDRPVVQRVRRLKGEELAALDAPFQDERLNQLLFRYRARIWPETLTAEQRDEWELYRHRRLISDPDLASIRLPEYEEQLKILMAERPEDEPILRELAAWPAKLGIE
ncbi:MULTISPECIES: exodeoxyribonuclease I [unclassified Wenzhouxiangella]|uniref:exodeoxyribonuclease I n=1 Tax=unclassified Wenzhouxiangella TaxID=2613841 RepID=UPI000E32B166|nr:MULTISPECIES: exodeoxyribonuclease I [unclassified Wenzhouxiangella]RFF26748.1 exodeoxyribonuclease I [Wenzhouxiangella sp. 15181]RFP68920.1 exodeoxyribonuclease I [Wenzhouxiangella sp. 15190]